MASEIEILVDSDAFVGRFYPNDKHHKTAKGIFSELEEKGSNIATTSMVAAETATVLSHRSGQDLARMFLSTIEKGTLPVIHVDEKLQQEAITIFKEQDKRGTSVPYVHFLVMGVGWWFDEGVMFMIEFHYRTFLMSGLWHRKSHRNWHGFIEKMLQ